VNRKTVTRKWPPIIISFGRRVIRSGI